MRSFVTPLSFAICSRACSLTDYDHLQIRDPAKMAIPHMNPMDVILGAPAPSLIDELSPGCAAAFQKGIAEFDDFGCRRFALAQKVRRVCLLANSVILVGSLAPAGKTLCTSADLTGLRMLDVIRCARGDVNKTTACFQKLIPSKCGECLDPDYIGQACDNLCASPGEACAMCTQLRMISQTAACLRIPDTHPVRVEPAVHANDKQPAEDQRFCFTRDYVELRFKLAYSLAECTNTTNGGLLECTSTSAYLSSWRACGEQLATNIALNSDACDNACSGANRFNSPLCKNCTGFVMMQQTASLGPAAGAGPCGNAKDVAALSAVNVTAAALQHGPENLHSSAAITPACRTCFEKEWSASFSNDSSLGFSDRDCFRVCPENGTNSAVCLDCRNFKLMKIVAHCHVQSSGLTASLTTGLPILALLVGLLSTTLFV